MWQERSTITTSDNLQLIRKAPRKRRFLVGRFLMKIGFIGTGIIASAVAAGFCESGIGDLTVTVSPRNAEKAAALQEKYPEIIRVAASNQQVVEESEWVFLSVLPKDAEAVIRDLTIPYEKKVVSLVSSLSLQRLKEISGEHAVCVDVLPLTFAAQRIGPVVVYPAVEEARELLSNIGDAIAVDDPQKIAVFRAITGLMSPYYMLLTKLIDWSVENGVDEPSARAYVTEFAKALTEKAAGWDGPLENLAREMTPGGFNWTALTHLEEVNAYTPWTEILAPIMEKCVKEK